MSQPLLATPGPLPNANEELAAKIVAALRTADFIALPDESAATALLNSKTVKAGDWLALLEKQLISSVPSPTDHAAPNQGT